jgi:hypothetical protein
MLSHSTTVNENNVGKMHKFAYIGETAMSIGISLGFKRNWLGDGSLSFGLYEFYENLLGGLDWNSFDASSHIIGLMDGGDKGAKLESGEFAVCLAEASLNAGLAHTFSVVAKAINNPEGGSQEEAFAVVAATVMFHLGKGKLLADDANFAAALKGYTSFSAAKRAELAACNVTIALIEEYVASVLPLLKSSSNQ